MWFQLRIEHCAVEEIESLENQLEEMGALSVMLTDKFDHPVLEPAPGSTPLWPEIIVEALFADSPAAQACRETLQQHYTNLSITINVFQDKDWERVWMDEFKPQQFGENLWICPSWCSPPDPNAINLLLDPGLAFGTGTHPTTRLCLKWLASANLEQKAVIDYGCGSGILAIAAAKLGAKSIDAVDIDPQALEATRNNALLNQVDPSHFNIKAPESLESAVDLIIANILLDPLLNLHNRFLELLKPGAELVVSGILKEQASLLKEIYQKSFDVIQQFEDEEWALIHFRRK